MNQVQIDLEKNLLIIVHEGSCNNIHEGNDNIIVSNARSLKPGFTIINDISKMRAASEDTLELIQKTQLELKKLSPSRVIRVVENPIPKMQLARTDKQAGYTAIEVKSMEEAMSIVDKSTTS